MITGQGDVEFELILHRTFLSDQNRVFHFSAREIRQELADVPFNYSDVIRFIQQYLKKGKNKIQLEEIL